MELNEMEKKLLFQVEGDYQTKILNELYMTVRYSNNSEQREAAEGLMAKLRVLSNAECMDLVKDIQKNYRLPYPARTIGEKIAEARQQSGAEKLKGHDIMALERFDPEVKHMIVFDVSKKDKSITYPSIYPAEPEAANRTDGMDRIELIEAYREIIKENIEYDLLVLRYGRERLDEALELMLEVILSKRPYIRIAGDDFPREIVKSRFLKINSGHLEYVFDCIDKNTTKVGNIKAYLLAALYNAPATMDSYYRAEVNHDLYGC